MAKPGLWRMLGFLFAALATTFSLAQESAIPYVKLGPPVPPADVVVTARPKVPPEAVRRQARAVTRMEDFYSAPLAQFQEPVCPGIVGLSGDVAGLMVDRIRHDAGLVGIPVAKENACRPNILIAFVRNGRADVKLLERKRAYLFNGITIAEMKELVSDSGPVHAWSNTAVRSRHGELIQGNPDSGNPPVVNAPMADSHVFLATRLDIESSVVVIDVTAIDGLSVDQIADYAAMRGLARTRPPRDDAAVGTILSLFDKEEGPRPMGLTPFDIAYLRSVYGALPNLPASAKLGAVSEAIRIPSTDRDSDAVIKH